VIGNVGKSCPFATGLKTLCITISGGQEKCFALYFSFVYKSRSSKSLSPLYIAKSLSPLYTWCHLKANVRGCSCEPDQSAWPRWIVSQKLFADNKRLFEWTLCCWTLIEWNRRQSHDCSELFWLPRCSSRGSQNRHVTLPIFTWLEMEATYFVFPMHTV
jgi:hypothetical protein